MKLSASAGELLAQLQTVSRVASTRSAVQALSGVQVVAEGGRVELVVDTRNLHFFDPETGLGIYDGSEKGAG